MARPIEVTDDEVIAAGRLLETRGSAVHATRLWDAVGRRGKPIRMKAVWDRHKAQLAVEEAPLIDRPLMPEQARQYTAVLKSGLAITIDQAMTRIYDDVHNAISARFEAELRASQAARECNVAEVDEALNAIGSLGEERDQLQTETRRAEDSALVMQGERDTARDLLQAATNENRVLVARLAAMDEGLALQRREQLAAATTHASLGGRIEETRNTLAIVREELRVSRLDCVRLQRELGTVTSVAQASEARLQQQDAEMTSLRISLVDASARFQDQVHQTVAAERAVEMLERAFARLGDKGGRKTRSPLRRRSVPMGLAQSTQDAGVAAPAAELPVPASRRQVSP